MLAEASIKRKKSSNDEDSKGQGAPANRPMGTKQAKKRKKEDERINHFAEKLGVTDKAEKKSQVDSTGTQATAKETIGVMKEGVDAWQMQFLMQNASQDVKQRYCDALLAKKLSSMNNCIPSSINANSDNGTSPSSTGSGSAGAASRTFSLDD